MSEMVIKFDGGETVLSGEVWGRQEIENGNDK